jgi:hypothetical protein
MFYVPVKSLLWRRPLRRTHQLQQLNWEKQRMKLNQIPRENSEFTT